MTAVAVCLIIGIINLILWAVLFLHFKSKYSSEKILEDIADELNKLIRDINNETNRCVTIVEACKKDIQNFVEESEKYVEESKKYTELGHETLSRKAQSILVMNTLNQEAQPSSTRQRRTSYSDLAPGLGYNKTAPLQQDLFDRAPVDEMAESEEKGYQMEISMDSIRELMRSSPQNELEQKSEEKAPAETFTSEIKVPEINISEIKLPEITQAQKQVLVEKSLRTRVLELHAEGFDLSTIASRLNITLSEVQVIVNLYGL